MSRGLRSDYAKKRGAPPKSGGSRSKPGGTTKGRGGRAAKVANRRLILLALATGLGVGLLAFGLHTLEGLKQGTPTTTPVSVPVQAPVATGPKGKATSTATAATAPTATPKAESPEAPPVEYEFFEILPHMKVAKPNVGAPRPPTDASGAALPLGQYLLQVGSFREAKEADARRAELALLGVNAQAVPVELPSGETWYRVQVGPLSERRQMDNVRQKLSRSNLDYILYKLKAPANGQ